LRITKPHLSKTQAGNEQEEGDVYLGKMNLPGAKRAFYFYPFEGF